MRKFEQTQRQADRAAGTPRPADAGQEAADQPEERQPPSPLSQLWGAVFFGLIPEVITLFGLLLWVPPLVHAELEGRTWIYLAVRPRGRVSVLLGKYLTAVAWTALAGWISTTICVCIVRPEDPVPPLVDDGGPGRNRQRLLRRDLQPDRCGLHRRAMVIAVGYTLIFEFLVSLIPAVINKLTVQYRLRGLLFTWMDWRGLMSPQAGEVFLGTEPAWLHLLILCGGVVVTLVVAVQVIQRKEYATVSDN